jgi:hypothetical protein
VNDRQAEFISQEVDRLMDEAGGDGWLALRMSVAERLVVSAMVSSGLARVAPVRQSGFLPKAKVEAIDIPSPTSPVAANPSA